MLYARVRVRQAATGLHFATIDTGFAYRFTGGWLDAVSAKAAAVDICTAFGRAPFFIDGSDA